MYATRRLMMLAVLSMICSYPQESEAKDVFKSSEFLQWDQENKALYIRTSIGMAGLIVSRNDKKQAKCLENWYFSDAAEQNDSIMEIMSDYPDYHPRGIILGVLEKQCGSLVYTD